MSNPLKDHFNKSQKYLKLGDQEEFKGFYVGWESVKMFNRDAYRFTLEREDGSRVTWDTSNSRAILQISDLIDKGMKKGTPICIHREGVTKEDTKYTITEGTPF